MRILRYILEHKVALAVVVAMFCIQACCDLALPTFTSDIVDVGVQQGGIQDAVVSEMTEATYDGIASRLAGEELSLFERSYEAIAPETEGTAPHAAYALSAYGEANRDELDAVMAEPLVAALGAGEGTSQDAAASTTSQEAASSAASSSSADGDTATSATSQDALLSQRAVAAAKAEYERCGTDLWSVQMDYLVHMGLLMLAVTLLALLVHVIMNFAACRAATQIGRDLRSRLFARVVDFSDRETDRFGAASLITRGTNDITQIQNLSLFAMRMLVYTPIIAVGGIVMVVQTSPGMGWIIVLGVAAVCALVGVLFKLTIPKFRIMQKLIDRVNLVSREILTGLPVVRAFGRERYEERRFTKANTDLLETQLFTNRAMAFMMPGMTLVMNGVSVAVVWVGAQYVDMGQLQTGDLIAFITYSMMIIASFLILGFIAIMIPRANVAAERVDEVIGTSSSIRDALEVYDSQVGEGEGEGLSIRFENVSFHYAADQAEDEVEVLRQVSFSVEPGQTCAIIGATGSGKSTVAKLLMRFYDVGDGRIVVGGYDVREMSQKRLHELIGYVPQAAFLFSGTIRSNVAYADGRMSDARVDEALRIAQAADFVASRDEGCEAPISQGGTNVSGGQRQRLSIARAIAADTRAYLFDDSFSALDYRTDAALRRELAGSLGGRTKIIVAQRISTVMDADLIVCLHEGRVAGAGTHAELLQGCEVYRDIALSQLSEDELGCGGDR